MTTNIVKHCEMKGRGKCGRVAKVWVRTTWIQYKAESVVTRAACDACAKGHEVVGPVIVTRKEVA